jgi:hypothetical protein
MKLSAMVGYKLFKEDKDGSLDILRIMYVKRYQDSANPTKIVVRNEITGDIFKMPVENLKEYTPLQPDGVLTFNIVNLDNPDNNKKYVKDVIVTASRYFNLQIQDKMPYAVCRQNITDIFYNLLVKDESEMIVGLAVNQDDCPAGFDFRLMLACTSIEFSELINFYRNDTIEDLYCMINKSKYDEVLNNLFKEHCKASGNTIKLFAKRDKGWSSSLNVLLSDNNFQNDINDMFGIVDIDFELKNFIVQKPLPGREEMFDSLTDDLKLWLSSIFKIAISEITVIKYDIDINLGDYNNTRYLMIRDSSKTLYMLVYTLNGQYHKSDLEALAEKKDFSTEFRIKFYNKYNHIK